MECPGCRTLNRPTARLCRECGTTLAPPVAPVDVPVPPVSQPDIANVSGTSVSGPSDSQTTVPATAAHEVASTAVAEVAGAPIEAPVSAETRTGAEPASAVEPGGATTGVTARPAGESPQSEGPPEGGSEPVIAVADPPKLPGQAVGLLETGTVVLERYELLEVLEPIEGRQRAIASDRNCHLQCWNCSSLGNQEHDEFCNGCGASLSDRRVLVWRSGRDDALWLGACNTVKGGVGSLLLPTVEASEAAPDGEGTVVCEMPSGVRASEAAGLDGPSIDRWLRISCQAVEDLATAGLAVNIATEHLLISNGRYILSGVECLSLDGSPSKKNSFEAIGQIAVQLSTGSTDLAQLSRSQLPGPLMQAINGMLNGGITTVATLTEILDARPSPARVPRVAGQSDVGMRRKNNEDGLAYWQGLTVLEGIPNPVGLYAVADGMGGGANGERACQVVLETLMGAISTSILSSATLRANSVPEGSATALLRDAVLAADRALKEEGKGLPYMGATITVALVIGNIATIANVGDARTYLFNKSSGLRQVTDDHSVVWERVKSGAITKAQIQDQTDRNVITRAIDNISVLTDKDVDVFRETLVPGDIMLQCSDGIWEMISDETIEGELRATTVLEDACSAMVVKANAAGGEDNATVLLVALG